MIMLSATIDRADEFASWIGNTKGKITNLIPTKKRVVPLEHYFFLPDTYTEVGNEMIKVFGFQRNFPKLQSYQAKL